MSHLLFLSYNNYYNRIVKQENTLDDYKNATTFTDSQGQTQYRNYTISNVNFHEGDLIDTEIIVNWDRDWMPDYLVCYTGTFWEPTLEHRWFVTDSEKTRKGQYKFTLHRDIIVDNYNEVINADTFIEKATVDEHNPLIFNNENMTYNQIKTGEEYITDKTNTQWIVGYLVNNRQSAIKDTFGYSLKADIDMHDVKSTDWVYYKYVTSGFREITSADKITYSLANKETGWWTHGNIYDEWYDTYEFRKEGSTLGYRVTDSSDFPTGFIIDKSYMNTVKDNRGWLNGWNMTQVKNDIINDDGYLTASQIKELMNYNNKKILFSDGIYTIRVDENGYKANTATLNSELKETFDKQYFERLNQFVKAKIEGLGASTANWFQHITINYSYRDHELKLEKATIDDGTSYTYNIPTGARPLLDSPYTMFAIPYYNYRSSGNYYIAKNDKTLTRPIDPDLMMAWAQSIVKQAGYAGSGTGMLLDLQILPYCPFVNDVGIQLSTDGSVRMHIPADYLVDIDYSFLYKDGTDPIYPANNYGVIFFCKHSSFSTTISSFLRPEYSINDELPVSDLFPTDDVKIRSETQFCRLTSPNYAGSFEFKPVKNGGVSAFKVDCAYKPYTPYIQVQPDFDWLYGSDYNDARGLICGGDFSLPSTSDAFRTYELSNKNYQLAFDRQIQNMEVNNSIARTEAVWSAVAGTAQGATTGAVAGGMIKGPVGAAVGAAVGGAASLAGGIADYQLLQRQQAEALDYTKDMFGFQLGNIKALPNTLNKVSSLTPVTKPFPFIEFYDSTDIEKDALRNKIKYNGMTVGVIGKIADYLQADYSYVKGKLIRLENSEYNDYHEVNAIANELNKGVFIK